MQWVVVLLLMGAYLHLRDTRVAETETRTQAEPPREREYVAPNDDISHLLRKVSG